MLSAVLDMLNAHLLPLLVGVALVVAALLWWYSRKAPPAPAVDSRLGGAGRSAGTAAAQRPAASGRARTASDRAASDRTASDRAAADRSGPASRPQADPAAGTGTVVPRRSAHPGAHPAGDPDAASPAYDATQPMPLPSVALSRESSALLGRTIFQPLSPMPPTPALDDEMPAPLLLVDDSAVVRAKLRKLMEGAGHRVLVANDGRQALDLLQRQRVALVITDLEMPHMDGLQLIDAMARQPGLAGLPVMAITGHDDLPLPGQPSPASRALGRAHAVVRKPWNDADLLARVQALLPADSPPMVQARRA